MVDFAENFNQYSKSKLPDFRDKFNGTSKWQQSGTSIAVNSATDQVDWDFSRDNINKAISHDLGEVSDNSWVLRFKFIVNNFTSISTSATGGWIGLYSDDHSVDSETPQSFFHFFIRNANAGTTQEIRMVQSDGTFSPSNSQLDVQFTHTFPVATAEYYEIRRESATSYRLSIYSDSSYTTLVETNSFTTSSAVSGLRYIKIAGFNFSTVAQTFDGNIDDVEFWDATAKPTFEEDFSTYNNQTEADNAWIPNDSTQLRVNPATNVLDFDMLMDGSNDAIALDLGVGNVDDNKWILRFILNMTTQVQDTIGLAVNIGISDSDQTVGSTASQDWIGFNYLNNNTFNGRWICAQSDDAQINGAGGNGTPVSELLPTATDIFFEIKRLSATAMEVNRYSDSTYTTIIGTSTHSAFSGTTGLRYIKLTNLDISNNAGVGIGTIDNIEFHNGVTEVPTGSGEGFVEGATTLEEDFTLRPTDFFDDFSYASQGVADTAWVSSDVARLDPFPNELTWDIPTGATAFEHWIYHDLGTALNDEKWTVRFKNDLQSRTSNNSIAIVTYFALSDNNTSRVTAQDHVGLLWSADQDAGDQEIRAVWGNAQAIGTNQSDIRTSVTVPETQYIEITRTSTTTVIINIYSDADYTILTDSITQVIPSTIVGLRYIKIALAKPGGSNALHGVMDDIEVYDGESVLTRWTSRALPAGVVNTKAKRVDWVMSRNGTDNRVIYDFGVGTVSDTNWLLKFRYHINAGGVITTGSGANYQVLFQDTDVGQSATNDTVGFSMSNTLSPIGRTFVLLARAGGSSNGFATTPDAIIPFGGAVDLFVELRRVSATSIVVNVYNDSDFTDLLTTLSITTTSATNGLRYLSCSSGDDNSPSWDGIETGFIDNIEFYNEQSVSKIPVKNHITFEDKFPYTTQPLADTAWAPQGTNNNVNITTNVIDYSQLENQVGEVVTHDLGVGLVSDTDWTLRWKHTVTTQTFTSATDEIEMVRLSSTSIPLQQAGPDSYIGFGWQFNNLNGRMFGIVNDVNRFVSNLTQDNFTTLFNTFGTPPWTRYFELKRTGSNSYEATVYSDPDYTNVIETVTGTWVGTLSDLRFIQVCNEDTAVTGGGVQGIGEVSDIQFWSGKSATLHAGKWKEIN